MSTTYKNNYLKQVIYRLDFPKINLGDFEEFKKDESNNSFLKSAHAQGLTNKQLDFILSEYDSRVIDLVSNSSQIDTDTTVQTLLNRTGFVGDSLFKLGYLT